jgi:hypothetical protein
MNASPTTVPDLIDAFGGPSAFAKVIGKGPSTAGEMKRAGRIDVRYWPSIIEAAPGKGVLGITAEALMRMHAPVSEPAGADQ